MATTGDPSQGTNCGTRNDITFRRNLINPKRTHRGALLFNADEDGIRLIYYDINLMKKLQVRTAHPLNILTSILTQREGD